MIASFMIMFHLLSSQIASAGSTPAPACPDCKWEDAARLLLGAGSEVSIQKKLNEFMPALGSQIQKDAAERTWNPFWGRSTSFDEAAKQEILPIRFLNFLKETTGEPLTEINGLRTFHAGFLHTYGYLFSTLKTPFGYKRKRWISGELERGFGLKEGLLSPDTPEGTLLGNVTYIAGSIAFRKDPETLKKLKKQAEKVPKEISEFQLSHLRIVRLLETVVIDQSKRVIELRTDTVSRDHQSPILIYSIRDSRDRGARLVTIFPIEKSFAEKIFDANLLGQSQTITTRYNAFVDGLTGISTKGTRTQEDLK